MTRRNLAGDPATDRTLRERADDLDAALAKRFPAGVLLEGVAFQATERRTLRHGLGARPRGVLVSAPRGGATFLFQVSADDAGVTLENATSNAATFDLWVYR